MLRKNGTLPKIDLKDRKIMRELDMNARLPTKQLAKKVGVSRQVAQYRIERLKSEGVISSFATIFDSAVVGKRWFRVVIRMQKIMPEEKDAFIRYFKAHPNIVWLGEVGGNWDFVLNLVSEDQFSFDRLFSTILERWRASIQKYEVLAYINVRDQQRKYILSDYGAEAGFLYHEMKFNPELKLDPLDKKIISLVSKNAILAYSAMANELGVSYKTVQARMKNMSENGLILGYRAMASPARLGYESYMIFLGTSTFRPDLEKQLDEFLKHPNVTFFVRQLGRWRIGMEAEFMDRNEFQAFLVELRGRFGDMIAEYEAFPIFHDHVIDYFPKGALDLASRG